MSGTLLEQLVDALRCLPGVGPKSAQRIAFHVLDRNRAGAKHLAETMLQAIERIGHCEDCRTYTEDRRCPICASDKRDNSVLCIVERPQDVTAIEQAAEYRGKYFVLLGRLSPLDGVRPEDIGMDLLRQRLASGVIAEVILAVSTTMEGEATAHYVAELARASNVRVSRIAYGVPLGGELEYIDRGTLRHALTSRRDL
ncbi:MAG: recombination protein RecR [Gammaproteobacteria bacterium]|nr:recombination protein RecR [Gammaproteobacteria bacterium]